MAVEILGKWARKSTSWQESIPSRVCQRMSYKQTKIIVYICRYIPTKGGFSVTRFDYNGA